MKSIREIALTPYYPYGRNKEKIIAQRIFEFDEALDKHDEYVRADERAKTIDEFAQNLKLKTHMENRLIDILAEQMKEQKNEKTH